MADILDGMFKSEDAPMEAVTTEPATPVETPAAEPVQPETPQEPEHSQEPQVEAPKEERTVPLATFLDQRDELRELRRFKQEREAQPQPQTVPDAFDDPAGYNDYVQRQISAAVQQNRVETSWTLAVRDYGSDVVEEAKTWALEKVQRDPVFRNQVDAAFVTEALPIDWVVQQRKRDALLSDIGDVSKLDDWFSREAAKRGYVAQSASVTAAPVVAAAQPAPRAPVPPRSIASDATPASSSPADPNAFWGFLDRK